MAWHGMAWHGMAASQDMPAMGWTWHGMAVHGQVGEGKAVKGRERQDRTGRDIWHAHGRVETSMTAQGRTGQGRGGHVRTWYMTGQGRICSCMTCHWQSRHGHDRAWVGQDRA